MFVFLYQVEFIYAWKADLSNLKDSSALPNIMFLTLEERNLKPTPTAKKMTLVVRAETKLMVLERRAKTTQAPPAQA